MHKDPFVVLGVGRDATQAEVKDAYEKLREEYRMAIHVEGDDGKKAAKKLSEVEDAYREAIDILSDGSDVRGVYTHVVHLLNQNDVNEAQAAIDKISERDAEWHYYQAAVYHAKGWNYEAKAQLDMAINMDPENKKYKETMERLQSHDAGSFGGNQGQPDGQRRRSYESFDEAQRRRATSDSAADFCMSLICADCLCECMGGDLIPCC